MLFIPVLPTASTTVSPNFRQHGCSPVRIIAVEGRRDGYLTYQMTLYLMHLDKKPRPESRERQWAELEIGSLTDSRQHLRRRQIFDIAKIGCTPAENTLTNYGEIALKTNVKCGSVSAPRTALLRRLICRLTDLRSAELFPMQIVKYPPNLFPRFRRGRFPDFGRGRRAVGTRYTGQRSNDRDRQKALPRLDALPRQRGRIRTQANRSDSPTSGRLFIRFSRQTDNQPHAPFW